jgi:hypothetical protein
MRALPVVALAVVAIGCTTSPAAVIDGRYDAHVGAIDAGPIADGGPGDAGAGPDASCTRATPPAPAAWTVPSSGGPAGETVTECLARAPTPSTDPSVPEDQRYDLTTFGGGADTQSVSCGGTADGTWYYAADAQRFACGQHVRLVDAGRTHCVIVQVADVGPHVCVEIGAGAPIWDVSPLAAMQLFGGSSYGWSDRMGVIGAPVGADQTLGACDAMLSATPLAGFIGGACTSDADCAYAGGVCRTAAQGYPGGYCTLACATGSCPDQAGANAFTGCADLGGTGEAMCAARCDYTLFPTTGCRDGYGCYDRPHPTSPTGAHRRVCLPLPCAA